MFGVFLETSVKIPLYSCSLNARTLQLHAQLSTYANTRKLINYLCANSELFGSLIMTVFYRANTYEIVIISALFSWLLLCAYFFFKSINLQLGEFHIKVNEKPNCTYNWISTNSSWASVICLINQLAITKVNGMHAETFSQWWWKGHLGNLRTEQSNIY